jgi:hypothetical protein
LKGLRDEIVDDQDDEDKDEEEMVMGERTGKKEVEIAIRNWNSLLSEKEQEGVFSSAAKPSSCFTSCACYLVFFVFLTKDNLFIYFILKKKFFLLPLSGFSQR